MGFIEETGAAQHLRDARIAAIYEGTNGIQAIDLAMRKVPLEGGAVVRAYLDELRDTVKAVQATNDPAFGATGARLAEAVDSLDRATTWLLSKVDKEPQAALAGATPYLRLFGNAAGGCMLADEALAALRDRQTASPASRIAIARFFAENIAVQASGPGARRHRGRRQRERRRRRVDGMSDHVTVADDGADPHRADEPPGQEERADRRDVPGDGGRAGKRQRPRRTSVAW